MVSENYTKNVLSATAKVCHIKKWSHFDGYGFNLHGDKAKPGQLIGKIDEDSPAQAGGLKIGDRIIEIDGVNVIGQNHNEVVGRIKVSGGGTEVKLLVADRECEAYHDDEEIDIESSLEYVLYLSSEKKDETSSESEAEEEPSRRISVSNHESDSDEGVGKEEDDGTEMSQNRKSSSSSSSSEEEAPRPSMKSSLKTSRTSYNSVCL